MSEHNIQQSTAGPEWLTTAGLSEMLGGIKTSTIRSWRFHGLGPPYVKLGGHVRYRRSAVEQWIAAGGDRSVKT